MPENNSTKKELPIILRILIKVIQFIVFAIIQLALLPLAIIGYMFIALKVLLYSKKLGISYTATEPLSARWMLQIFGLREDEASIKMMTSLPNISVLGLWCMMGPSIIANRICGYTLKLARIPEPGKASLVNFVNCRTDFFDKIYGKKR